jgi:hypothetical protein
LFDLCSNEKKLSDLYTPADLFLYIGILSKKPRLLYILSSIKQLKNEFTHTHNFLGSPKEVDSHFGDPFDDHRMLQRLRSTMFELRREAP